MKKQINLTLILICSVQILIAQQNTSSAMKMLVKQTWTKSHEQLGTITLAFKADSTYTVVGIPDNTIKGVFSLRSDVLTFENENSCDSKGIYTITVTDETLNFVLKEDACDGRNMITPGIWKASK
jgi:ABC-type uncharacterized transport system auxiliary subunit